MNPLPAVKKITTAAAGVVASTRRDWSTQSNQGSFASANVRGKPPDWKEKPRDYKKLTLLPVSGILQELANLPLAS